MNKKPESQSAEHSAVDTLVQQLKELIQSKRLGVGDSLPSEREIGEQFSAARNTVREAIRILKAYGVVDVRPKVGAVIINNHIEAAFNLFSFQLTISPETFLDIQGFRSLIEIGSVDNLFKRVTEADIAALKMINQEMRQAKTAKVASQKDFDFHCALLAIHGNKTVGGVYSMLQPIILQLMETGKESSGLEGAFEAHNEILEALRKQDRLAFQYLMSKHLAHGLDYLDEEKSS